MKLNNPALFKEAAFLNGQWLTTSKTIPVYNPANGALLGEVPCISADQVSQVIADAELAWEAYRKLNAKQRADLLFRFRKQIMDNKDDLARIITLEQGKPLAEAHAEIISSANTIEWFAEEVKRIYGETIPPHATDKRLMTIKQPVGVVAAITPWNFPSSMVTRKCAPALAAGCPIIIKPSPESPFSAIALAHLAQQAGFAPGIVNVITGDASIIGQTICADKRVRKLSFTGSTNTGKLLLKAAAETIKKTTLELGGNAPFIVFDDADIDKAVAGVVASKFRNTGQTCICANRLLVQDGVHDAFVEKLTLVVNKLKQGDGLGDGNQLGPLINQSAVDRAQRLIDDATVKGAKLITGGHSQQLFFAATILTEVNQSMQISHEEIFAPIAPITRFKDEQEAIDIANSTDYGLAAYFYSKDISRIYRVAEAIETGMVGINTGSISTEVAPFGGIKHSGIGREGSKYGIEEYVEIKYLCLDVA